MHKEDSVLFVASAEMKEATSKGLAMNTQRHIKGGDKWKRRELMESRVGL